MAYKVNANICARCGACDEVCPMNAIEIKADAAYINPDQCIDCGSCAASCPLEAIDPE